MVRDIANGRWTEKGGGWKLSDELKYTPRFKKGDKLTCKTDSEDEIGLEITETYKKNGVNNYKVVQIDSQGEKLKGKEISRNSPFGNTLAKYIDFHYDLRNNKKTRSLEILSLSGLILGFIFLSPNITGNIILVEIPKKVSSIFGGIILTIGVVASCLWLNKKIKK